MADDAGNAQRSGPGADDPARTPIEKRVVTPAYDRTAEQVRSEFDELDPATISEAAVAWRNAASRLSTFTDAVRRDVAGPLGAAWSGDASAGPQNALRLMQATALALADRCARMAEACDRAATYAEKAKAQVGAVTPAASATQQAALDDRANGQLVELMTQYNDVIESLPVEVPGDPSGAGPAGTPAGSGAGAGAGPALHGVGPGGSLAAHAAVAARHSSAAAAASAATASPYTAESMLAGRNATGLDPAVSSALATGIDGALPGTTPGGVPGVGGAGGLGGAAGFGGAGALLGVGALGTAGIGGTPGSGARRGTGPGAEGLAGDGSRSASGQRPAALAGAMLPVGQGEAADGERRTWLVEDDDVWGDDADLPPPIIAG